MSFPLYLIHIHHGTAIKDQAECCCNNIFLTKSKQRFYVLFSFADGTSLPHSQITARMTAQCRTN